MEGNSSRKHHANHRVLRRVCDGKGHLREARPKSSSRYVVPAAADAPDLCMSGERKLYLLVEGDSEMKVKSAINQVKEPCGHGVRLTFVQFKKLLQEATLESDEAQRPLFSKYTV
eukprot:169897-Hanusia_phi.AAC.2